MSAFSSFLKEEAERIRAESPRREARIREWVDAVARLLAQIKEWLNEADPEHILRLEEEQISRTEPSLGQYTIPALRIKLGDRVVGLIPVARNVLAPTEIHDAALRRSVIGRVDLTEGTYSYVLYRIQSEGGETWLLTDELGVFTFEPLSREAFEKALLRLLK